MQPVVPSIVGMGEVLWDLLPSGKVLGGAPFNFTFHCHQLGHAAVMISRVGSDAPGAEIRDAMRGLGLDDRFVQDDDRHPTGTVGVQLDSTGQPSYTIHPGAWDHLAWEDQLVALLGQAQAVCFGTLIQRSDASRATVRRALRAGRDSLVVFDVNLRQEFFSREVLEESLRASRWVKLNDDELEVLRKMFLLSSTNKSATVADLRKRFGIELVALDSGREGVPGADGRRGGVCRWSARRGRGHDRRRRCVHGRAALRGSGGTIDRGRRPICQSPCRHCRGQGGRHAAHRTGRNRSAILTYVHNDSKIPSEEANKK